MFRLCTEKRFVEAAAAAAAGVVVVVVSMIKIRIIEKTITILLPTLIKRMTAAKRKNKVTTAVVMRKTLPRVGASVMVSPCPPTEQPWQW